MSGINQVPHQNVRNVFNNQSLGSPNLARDGSTAAQIRTQIAIHFRIDGQNFYKAATAGIALTAQPVQPILTTCYYLILIDKAGAVTCLKGTNGSTVLPNVPAGRLLIGVMRVVLANAATFTSGTTALNATDVTTTFAHPAYMPEGNLATALTFA